MVYNDKLERAKKVVKLKGDFLSGEAHESPTVEEVAYKRAVEKLGDKATDEQLVEEVVKTLRG